VATACGDDEDSAEKVVAGVTDAKPTARNAFSSCGDRDASMQVHVYASGDFIKRVAADLRISEVQLVHPPSRYHIVP
jgi:hypothetical protein